MVKSIREAGVNSRWVFGDRAYEARVEALVGHALDAERGADFLVSFRDAAARFGAFGEPLGLVQTVLKLTVPGVPDVCQGAELWERSLVDPDNRRPIDFGLRKRMLADLGGTAVPSGAGDASGATKLAIISRLLAFGRRDRRSSPRATMRRCRPAGAVRVGSVPTIGGPPKVNCWLRLVGWRAQDSGDWAVTGALADAFGAAGWQDILSGTASTGGTEEMFARLPVAVFSRPGG